MGRKGRFSKHIKEEIQAISDKSFWHHLLCVYNAYSTTALALYRQRTVTSQLAKGGIFPVATQLLLPAIRLFFFFFNSLLPVFRTSCPSFKKQNVYIREKSNYHQFCDIKAHALGKVIMTYFSVLKPFICSQNIKKHSLGYFSQWLRKALYLCCKSVPSVHALLTQRSVSPHTLITFWLYFVTL